jgi:peptidoglycan hydrolase CwlO-like protein
MKVVLISLLIALEAFILTALWMSWSEARTASFEAGMANARVKALKEQVNVQAKTLQDYRSDISILRNTVARYDTSISLFEAQIYEYTGQIEALRLEIQEMKKPTIVIPPSKPKKGKK